VLGNTGGRIGNDDGVEQGDDGVAATNLDWDGFAENGMLGGGASAPTQDQDQGIGSSADIDWSEFSSN